MIAILFGMWFLLAAFHLAPAVWSGEWWCLVIGGGLVLYGLDGIVDRITKHGGGDQ